MTFSRKVEEAMKNLTCCDMQTLLVEIGLVMTRTETEEVSY